MPIGEFILANPEKVNRAIHGMTSRGGGLVGGVGEGEGAEWEAKLIAEYDRLGGLITKDNAKVKTGCFYDFDAKKPVAKPNVILLFRVNGDEVEVPDGEPLPLAVRAQQVVDEAAAGATPKKKSTKKAAKKEAAADEEVDA